MAEFSLANLESDFFDLSRQTNCFLEICGPTGVWTVVFWFDK